MEQQIQLNDHNKQEYPPMHTAEHLLNATIVKTCLLYTSRCV